MARREIEWGRHSSIFWLGPCSGNDWAAGTMVQAIFSLTGDHLLVRLATIYVATAVPTNFVTNNAVAALMFPIAVAAAAEASMPFMLMFAASAAFATPMRHQFDGLRPRRLSLFGLCYRRCHCLRWRLRSC